MTAQASLFPVATAATDTTAVLSPCGRYRYHLRRQWGEGLSVLFIMLNPSTADATVDDPTIRRCIGFATSWGCGALEVVNLFGLRATDPKQLFTAADPVGPDNDRWIEQAALRHEIIVAGWGSTVADHRTRFPEALRTRDRVVEELIGPRLCALDLTKGGEPRHPLYLRADLEPKRLAILRMLRRTP